MAKIEKFAHYNGATLPLEEARLSIASSAVIYGLSVYTVFYAAHQNDGSYLAFRLDDHLRRLADSSKMIGLTGVGSFLEKAQFVTHIKSLIEKNKPEHDQLFRVTLHADENLPGIRTSDINVTMSIFAYDATPILPIDGARLKTSSWRRVSDVMIPARAKVNGAYVNGALARQDALNAGCDDALLLSQQGFVSELSAANIFLVKDNTLVTPDLSSDILEGITRRSIINLAKEQDMDVIERKVALTECYVADEIFACGTSSFVTPILKLDSRIIGEGGKGAITNKLRGLMQTAYNDPTSAWTTKL